jgi:hypothetical protein
MKTNRKYSWKKVKPIQKNIEKGKGKSNTEKHRKKNPA